MFLEKSLCINSAPIIWIFGLSGAGKSTIANALLEYFQKKNIVSIVIDGDVIRKNINKDLDFSDAGRHENIRRIAEIAKMLSNCKITTIVSCITPFESDRFFAKELLKNNNLFYVFIDTPIEICIQRDAKGLYKKAIKGEVQKMTGISSKFEQPKCVDILIKNMSVKESVIKILTSIMPNIHN